MLASPGVLARPAASRTPVAAQDAGSEPGGAQRRRVRERAAPDAASGLVLRAPPPALALLPALVCLGSWGLHLRAGRFLDADSARFAWGNLQAAWFRTYLLESEGRLVWGAGAALALGSLALLRLALRRRPRRVLGAPLGTWLCFLILLGALVVGPASRELLPERRVRALDALAYALHPALTLLSTWDLGAAEPEASTVLDERTLVRRCGPAWWVCAWRGRRSCPRSARWPGAGAC